MPGAIGQQPVGRAGSSTVQQPPYGTQATRPTLVARALIAVRRIFFTAEDLADAKRLYQVLYQMQQGNIAALHALGSSPLAAGVYLAGVTFAAGQTQYLSHGLGRAYTGWVPCRPQTNAWSGKEVALPAGVTADKAIGILSANAGTYDFWVY